MSRRPIVNDVLSTHPPAPLTPIPHPYTPERLQCPAERDGQQCMLDLGHTGSHKTPTSSFLFWDRPLHMEADQDSVRSALLWVDWARTLGVDAANMQVQLMRLCRQARVSPTILLVNLTAKR